MPLPFGASENQPKCVWLELFSYDSPQAKFPAPCLGERRALLMKITLLPTLTDSGLVTMTEVLWKTLTRTTGPYFLALETKVIRKRLSKSPAQAQLEKQGIPPQDRARQGPRADSLLSHSPHWASASTSTKWGCHTPLPQRLCWESSDSMSFKML